MVEEERVLPDGAEDVTASDVVTDLVVARCKVPLLGAVKGGDIDTAGNVDAVGHLCDALEGTLNTVVDGLHETRAEFDREGLTSSGDGVTNGNTGCVCMSACRVSVEMTIGGCSFRTSLFVNLDCGLVGRDANHLSHEVLMSDFDLGQSAVLFVQAAIS